MTSSKAITVPSTNTRLRVTLFAGAITLTLLALVFFVHRSSAATGQNRDASLPVVVLVHGAWADSSAWDAVTSDLQAKGFTVYAEANPLRGLLSDAAYLRSFLSTIQKPVVLVGHSYGGAVITNAAAGVPNVKALVYIDAFAPAQGETVLQLATQKPGSAIGGDPTKVFDVVPYPGAPANDVDLYVKQAVFVQAFANDLPAKEAAALASAQRPVTLSALATPSGVPAWKTIRSWYFIGTKDNVIPPAEQTFMAQRAHSVTVDVPASHLAMVSRPGAVTRLILTAASSVH